jgi:hypothetical protein
MRDVAPEPVPLDAAGAPAAAGDDRLHAYAALAGRELVVFLPQALARAEQGALDRRAAHAQALADVVVAQALELAHDQDLVMVVGDLSESSEEMVDVLLDVDCLGRLRRGGDETQAIRGREPFVGLERDLLRAPPPAVGVDAGVLGDLVDPRLEGDRSLGLAHAPQRGDEHLLRDVLGPAVVLDHPADVGGDAALVALVELLEGAVVAASHRAHQLMVAAFRCSSGALNERRAADPHRFHCAYPASALTDSLDYALPVTSPGKLRYAVF